MSSFTPIKFYDNVELALNDPNIRNNFDGAMKYLRDKRAAVFPSSDEELAVKALSEHIRQYSLSHLSELLVQLEKNCLANGIHVHWAETAQEANSIFLSIAKSHQAKNIVKGKSMATEEIELNHFMARHDIRCLESDMGEFIVQLDDDKPSHIIMPAIHKNVEQINDTFNEHLPDFQPTDDVSKLIQVGRECLRKEFESADIGVSGVNFAIADAGALCLVENEGNGRMSTTVPPVHIALMGIEKVIEQLTDIPPLYSALTRSATGQKVTTYLNIISGPKAKDDIDGPDEVHLILLDNGRTNAYQNEDTARTLQCIRCGACMNHCPVYKKIGGHAYGTTYPGPIGQIFSPHILNVKDTKSLVTASTLCGACADVCPVKIPIPQLLRKSRERVVDEGQNSSFEKLGMWFYQFIATRPKWFSISTHIFRKIMRVCNKLNYSISRQKTLDQRIRIIPTPAKEGVAELLKSKNKGD